MPILVHETDQRYGHAADLGGQRDDLVEIGLVFTVEDVEVTQRLKALCIQRVKIGAHGHFLEINKRTFDSIKVFAERIHQKRAASRQPLVTFGCDEGDQPFTLSFRAFAMVILTTLSASFLNCSPVAGLRTMRSGRSRQ